MLGLENYEPTGNVTVKDKVAYFDNPRLSPLIRGTACGLMLFESEPPADIKYFKKIITLVMKLNC